jgi:hypothetical protein
MGLHKVQHPNLYMQVFHSLSTIFNVGAARVGCDDFICHWRCISSLGNGVKGMVREQLIPLFFTLHAVSTKF